MKSDVEGYNFCLDFQNQGCTRSNCKFIHADSTDVDAYKHTNSVSLSLARAIAAMPNTEVINGLPLCREFETHGSCARGASCRYWHINREEERERRMAGMSVRPMGPGANNSPFLGNPNGRNTGGYGAVLPSSSAGVRRRAPFDEYEEPPAYKRSMVESRHVMDLERRNVEQAAEIESLRRELRRERERYEDLLSLFRSTTSGGGVSRPEPVIAPQPIPAPPQADYIPTYAHSYSAGWTTDAETLIRRQSQDRYDWTQ